MLLLLYRNDFSSATDKNHAKLNQWPEWQRLPNFKPTNTG